MSTVALRKILESELSRVIWKWSSTSWATSRPTTLVIYRRLDGDAPLERTSVYTLYRTAFHASSTLGKMQIGKSTELRLTLSFLKIRGYSLYSLSE
jgi:hypothetical protein